MTVIESLARIGYAAKGLVYLVIAVSGLLTAISRRPQTQDFDGVLLKVFQRPFGGVLLVALTIGLLCYAIWCFLQAVLDAEGKGNGATGIVIRGFYALVGIVYAGVGWSAIEFIAGRRRLDPGDRTQHIWISKFLVTIPFANWMLALVGVGFEVFCLYEVRRALASQFQILEGQPESEVEDVAATVVGKIGITARALVFAFIGLFIIRSAIDFDPTKTHGIGGTLDALVTEPFGPWLLGLLCLGLISYAFYMFFLSLRRQIEPG